MTEKEKILQGWRPGDDAKAVRYLRSTGFEITPNALLRWRHGGGSKSTPIYINAYAEVQKQRRAKQAQ